jgi:hypothetical protein
VAELARRQPLPTRPLVRVLALVVALAVVAAVATVVVTVVVGAPDADRSRVEPPAPTGTALPSSADCAAAVPRTGFEPRPENAPANRTTPPPGHRVPDWPGDGYAPGLNAQILPRIDGAYTGTTDEILQWGACKWGLPSAVVRAMAVEESNWDQRMSGDVSDDDADCVPGDEAPCATSFGILQVKHLFRPGSYPLSRESTAFNVDYALGAVRGCFEGHVVYLQPYGYRSGDLWGCVGWHFSGEWYDAESRDYVERVRSAMDAAAWQSW